MAHGNARPITFGKTILFFIWLLRVFGVYMQLWMLVCMCVCPQRKVLKGTHLHLTLVTRTLMELDPVLVSVVQKNRTNSIDR